MNVQLPGKMDQQRFLAWVQGREERYELDRGRVIMMTGGSRAHGALTARLDPDQFAVLPEFGVDLGPDSIRSPDVVVDAAGEASDDLKATAPALIVEVLSPSSERIDVFEGEGAVVRIERLTIDLPFAAVYDRVRFK
jgi:Uma2 family endonuclease